MDNQLGTANYRIKGDVEGSRREAEWFSDYDAECPLEFGIIGKVKLKRGDIDLPRAEELADSVNIGNVVRIVNRDGGVAVAVRLIDWGSGGTEFSDFDSRHGELRHGCGYWSITAKEIKKEFGGDLERAVDYIHGMIETVNRYTRGEALYFNEEYFREEKCNLGHVHRIEVGDGDSCGGIYPTEGTLEGSILWHLREEHGKDNVLDFKWEGE